jgi:hypothetical protein
MSITGKTPDSRWRTAQVAEILSQSQPSNPDSAWLALLEMTSRAPLNTSLAHSGVPWNVITEDYEKNSDPLHPDFYFPVGLTMSILPRCCLVDGSFKYPATGPRKVMSPAGECKEGASKLVGFQFTAKARFKDEPFPPCRCSCCEFRQEVIYQSLTLSAGGYGHTRQRCPSSGATEDCSWEFKDKAGKVTRRVPACPGDPKPTALDGELGPELYCYGHRGEGGTSEDSESWYSDTEDGAAYSVAGCFFQMKDTPHADLKCDGWTMKLETWLRGEIRDICRNNRVLAEGWIDVIVRAYAPKNGKVRVKMWK